MIATDDSPAVLEWGEWVLRGHVRVWQAWGPPPPPPPREDVPTECRCCGEPLGVHGGRGLRKVCYMRHRKAGTLDRFPRFRGSAA